MRRVNIDRACAGITLFRPFPHEEELDMLTKFAKWGKHYFGRWPIFANRAKFAKWGQQDFDGWAILYLPLHAFDFAIMHIFPTFPASKAGAPAAKLLYVFVSLRQ